MPDGNSTAATARAMPGASAAPPALSPKQVGFLASGLAGSFLVNLTAQFMTTNVADIQGAIGASADEASWLATVYAAGNLVGIVLAGPLVKVFGMRRYVSWAAIVFALAALAAIAAPQLEILVCLRAVQGLVAGGFGPVAFIATFMVMSGPRLPKGLVMLAVVLLLPNSIGPVASAAIENLFGWSALYSAQVIVGVGVALLTRLFLPNQPFAPSNFRADWIAIGLLCICLSASMLFLSQGTRRFWFDDAMITMAALVAAAAFVGFMVACFLSPMKVILPKLLWTPRFGTAILLNLVFRASFAVTGYLVPQMLAIIHGYRPVELAGLLAFSILAQALAFPLTWRLLHHVDPRWLMVAGLVCCAAATMMGATSTGLTAANELRSLLALFAFGQAIFLASDLLVGASALKPADLPTASILFNVTTLGGTTLGVGLVSNFVIEREKFHSSVLTEHIGISDSSVADRITSIAATLSSVIGDEGAAVAQATQLLGASSRKQAWVLAFNDGFLVVALALLAVATLAFIIPRTPPLRHADKR